MTQTKRFIRLRINTMLLVSSVLLLEAGYVSAECPCDIFEKGGTPCVAAHSTVRAMYDKYAGPLYQVRRTSDNKTMDIPVKKAGGFADSKVQDDFLGNQAGTISKIYDQSPNGNDLTKAPGGKAFPQDCHEANATKAKIKVNGYDVYGIYTEGAFAPGSGAGYRDIETKGVITGNGAEGMYMVCGGKHYNEWCCFDYGNAQKTVDALGPGTMESIYFGSSKQWGYGSGSGPWVMNDCEFGIQAGVDPNGAKGVYMGNTSINADYAVGIVKSDTSNVYAIRGGDATKGTIKTMYRGRQYPGYYPKKLEGSIVLGVGGDNSHTGEGTFFEGAMTKGMPSDETEDELQKNIIAAGYGSQKTSVEQHIISTRMNSPIPVAMSYESSQNRAVLCYDLSEPHQVNLNIFDQQGRQVATISNGNGKIGINKAYWETKRVPAGTYIWTISVSKRDAGSGKIVIGK